MLPPPGTSPEPSADHDHAWRKMDPHREPGTGARSAPVTLTYRCDLCALVWTERPPEDEE